MKGGCVFLLPFVCSNSRRCPRRSMRLCTILSGREFTSVRTAPAAGMAAADMSGVELRKPAVAEKLKIFAHCAGHCLINVYTEAVELHESAAPYPANNDGVHILSAQCCDGIAHAVLVVPIGVVDYVYRLRFRIHDYEGRRRSEMSVDFTFKGEEACDGKADFHVNLLICR